MSKQLSKPSTFRDFITHRSFLEIESGIQERTDKSIVGGYALLDIRVEKRRRIGGSHLITTKVRGMLGRYIVRVESRIVLL